jgi:hypothetical protein
MERRRTKAIDFFDIFMRFGEILIAERFYGFSLFFSLGYQREVNPGSFAPFWY